jgi:hypothetical protein
MIIRRADFLAALKRQKLDEPKFGHIGDSDQTVIALFARRMLAVMVQAEALYWEQGGDVSTPARAALALALHAADPEIFHFPKCRCTPLIEGPCSPCCARQDFVEFLRWRARTPLKLSLFQRLKIWWRS